MPERGHDVALDGEPVLDGGRRLAAHRHVLAQVAPGQGGDGDALGPLRLRHGLLARADAGDDQGRAAAGLCRAPITPWRPTVMRRVPAGPRACTT